MSDRTEEVELHFGPWDRRTVRVPRDVNVIEAQTDEGVARYERVGDTPHFGFRVGDTPHFGFLRPREEAEDGA
jgi:hypothetical protein